MDRLKMPLHDKFLLLYFELNLLLFSQYQYLSNQYKM